jgi:hypothetical protein
MLQTNLANLDDHALKPVLSEKLIEEVDNAIFKEKRVRAQGSHRVD